MLKHTNVHDLHTGEETPGQEIVLPPLEASACNPPRIDDSTVEPSLSTPPGAARKHTLAAVTFGALTYGAAALGTLVMRGRGSPKSLWFRSLRKPAFQPPNKVFGPVWTVLYGLVAYSGYRIWKSKASPARTRALGLWGAQLVLNGMWTPLFFAAHKPVLALADIVALDVAAGALAATTARIDKPATAVLAPYLGWLGFATVLNATIVAKNPRVR